MKGDSKDEIQAKVEALAQSAHKLAEAMYAQAQPDAAAGEEQAESKDDGVVDAEYEEVDDDKK